MELNEFKIGQWYKANNVSNFYYKVIGIDTKKRTTEPSLDVTQINGGDYKADTYISNYDYWQKATPIDYSEIEQYIPEEYRQPKEISPLIFN